MDVGSSGTVYAAAGGGGGVSTLDLAGPWSFEPQGVAGSSPAVMPDGTVVTVVDDEGTSRLQASGPSGRQFMRDYAAPISSERDDRPCAVRNGTAVYFVRSTGRRATSMGGSSPELVRLMVVDDGKMKVADPRVFRRLYLGPGCASDDFVYGVGNVHGDIGDDLRQVNRRDGSVRRITRTGDLTDVAVNPASGRLAYCRLIHGEWSVYVSDADGSHPSMAVTFPRRLEKMLWSQDGKYLLALLDRSDGAELVAARYVAGQRLQFRHVALLH